MQGSGGPGGSRYRYYPYNQSGIPNQQAQHDLGYFQGSQQHFNKFIRIVGPEAATHYVDFCMFSNYNALRIMDINQQITHYKNFLDYIAAKSLPKNNDSIEAYLNSLVPKVNYFTMVKLSRNINFARDNYPENRPPIASRIVTTTTKTSTQDSGSIATDMSSSKMMRKLKTKISFHIGFIYDPSISRIPTQEDIKGVLLKNLQILSQKSNKLDTIESLDELMSLTKDLITFDTKIIGSALITLLNIKKSGVGAGLYKAALGRLKSIIAEKNVPLDEKANELLSILEIDDDFSEQNQQLRSNARQILLDNGKMPNPHVYNNYAYLVDLLKHDSKHFWAAFNHRDFPMTKNRLFFILKLMNRLPVNEALEFARNLPATIRQNKDVIIALINRLPDNEALEFARNLPATTLKNKDVNRVIARLQF